MTKRRIFGSISAQHDNLGDIAIRSVFFRSLELSEVPLTLLTGRMPKSYVDLFDFSEKVELISSPIRFQMHLLKAAIKGKADLVYAPGPHLLSDSFACLAKTALMLANIALIRSTGGGVQTAGRALRGPGRMARYLERKLVSSSKLYVVRDSVSGSVIGLDLRSAPDLAFGRQIIPRTNPRGLVSCSFRSDTPINKDTFRRVVQKLTASGFEVVLVSQVKRDDFQHQKLAQEFALRALLWGENTHSEQQRVVDSTYAASHAVISNRLHGLIFGIMAGAIPVEYRIGSSDKIRSTLSPWFKSLPVIEDDGQDILPEGIVEQVSEHFSAAVLQAQSKVNEVLAEFAESPQRP
ncbi:polysaccharide pyruvyl transferase family protein [Pseudarthrobacter oxydans]|uniref:polysaccharide pyruvyl transferase family protein n=1 Tax=Pseudarthrobacter oxydans TaxID=1671 RepID=UPI00157411C0|nr:polysaccharide pyruvyl transferase family protein [Pseudarthrobacter oxydans]NSX38683.1 polysaccharide pyruvyl transferase family protein [Pseudarthrobacter oxydans]